MRKALSTTLALAALAASYIAYPFLTVWSIREAVREANAPYLERKIEWDTVRVTMRESLARIALPAPSGRVAPGRALAARPGLWHSIKARVGERALDSFVDRYVTPEGLPKLFTYRKLYREYVTGEPPAMSWHERLASFWSRVKRAEFKSPAVFEIEMADRHEPTRHYVGLLELRGLEWKLTELRLYYVGVPAQIAGGETS